MECLNTFHKVVSSFSKPFQEARERESSRVGERGRKEGKIQASFLVRKKKKLKGRSSK